MLDSSTFFPNMAKGLQKSVQDYLARLRVRPLPFPTSRFLAACKHPKTLSFSNYRRRSENNQRRRDEAATLQDIDRFLAENFASLYQDEADEEEEYEKDDAYPKTLPRLPASRRPLVPPSRNAISLADEVRPSSASSSLISAGPCASSSSLSAPDDDNEARLPGDTLAEVTYSVDPYVEFCESMQEVVASRWASGVAPPDWDFFEDLLLCYLNLNERTVHKYILGAFVDLVAGFRQGFGREDLPVIPETRKKVVEGERTSMAAEEYGLHVEYMDWKNFQSSQLHLQEILQVEGSIRSQN